MLIGGYAVNSYALPRFSVDCDIVTKTDAEKITDILKLNEYKQTEKGGNKNFHIAIMTT